jgi:O-antigen/teichoic acid export membrane protein
VSRSLRFVRDVGWSLASQGGVSLVNLFALPALVRGFGVEEYGLFVLLHAAVSYLQLLQLGAGPAVVKYLSEHHSAGEGRAAREALSLSLRVSLAGALAGAVALWAAAPWAVTEFFGVPERLHGPGVSVLRLAAVGGVLAAGAQWAQNALQGFRRFDQQNLLVLLQGTFLPLGVLLLFRFDKGLRAASLWYCALAALTFAAGLRAARAEEERLDRAGPALDRAGFLRYGLGHWFGPIAWIVSNQLDKVFIARELAFASVALYAVPTAVLQRLSALPAAVSAVLIPTMTEVRGGDAPETLRRMYLRVARVLLLIILPVLVLLFAFMPQFLSLWIGGRFSEDSVWPARLLVVAQAIGLLAFVPHAVAASRGHARYLTIFSAIQAFGSVAAWALLIPRLGLTGAALGTLAATAAATAVQLVLTHRLLALSWGRYAAECLLPAGGRAALLLAAVFPVHHLAADWPRLIGLCAAGALLYHGLAWTALSRDDRELLKGLLKSRFG